MRRFLIVSFFAASACLLALFPRAAAAEVVFPPGSRIGLEPPPGLLLSKTRVGFEDLDRKVAITIIDAPMPAYEKIEKDLFGVPPSKNGLVIDKRESFPFANGIGFLASGHEKDNGVAMRRWFFLARAVAGPGGSLTAFVTVDMPDTALSVYPDAAIRKSLASITFRKAPIAEQVALLPFKFGDLAGFTIATVLPTGSIILTDGPPETRSHAAYVVVSLGRGGPQEPGDRGAFARELMQSMPVPDMTITSGEAMRIQGSPGYEIRALAKDPQGNPIILVQWLRFVGSSFLRVLGVAHKEEWDNLFPRFRALRDGIEAK